MSKGREHLKQFWSYVGYGLGACILLVIPLIAIDWLLKNLPFLGTLVAELRKRVSRSAGRWQPGCQTFAHRVAS